MTQEQVNSQDGARLDELEIKYAYQQETIDALNEAVTNQWDVIEKLRRQIERLEARMADIGSWASGSGNDEPPPPHY